MCKPGHLSAIGTVLQAIDPARRPPCAFSITCNSTAGAIVHNCAHLTIFRPRRCARLCTFDGLRYCAQDRNFARSDFAERTQTRPGTGGREAGSIRQLPSFWEPPMSVIGLRSAQLRFKCTGGEPAARLRDLIGVRGIIELAVETKLLVLSLRRRRRA